MFGVAWFGVWSSVFGRSARGWVGVSQNEATPSSPSKEYVGSTKELGDPWLGSCVVTTSSFCYTALRLPSVKYTQHIQILGGSPSLI